MSSVIANLKVLLSADSAQLRTALGRAQKQTDRWASNTNRRVNQVGAAFVSLGATITGAMAFGDVVRRADSMILLEARIANVVGEGENLVKAMKDIRRVAKESRSEIKATGELYTKLAISTQHLNLTQATLANMTQTVLDTFILSGASASEAANSARQFAQGLASGRLQGDELRSVLENNVVLANLLAEGFGVTVGELRLMGEEGQLTADKLVNVLGEAFQGVREDVNRMRMTFGQATTIMSGEFTNMIKRIEDRTPFISIMVKAVQWASQNMVHLAWAVGTLVSTGFVTAAFFIGRWLVALHPVGLAITSVIAAAAGMSFWVSKNANMVGKVLFDVFQIRIPQYVVKANMAINKFARGSADAWNNIVSDIASSINKLIGYVDVLPYWVKQLLGWGEGGVTLSALKIDTTKFDDAQNKLEARLAYLKALSDAYKDLIANGVAEEFSTLVNPAAEDSELPEKMKSFTDILRGVWTDLFKDIKEEFGLLSKDSTWSSIFAAASKHSKKILALHKGIAIAKVIMDTASGISGAFGPDGPPGWPAKIAAAAQVAAVGATNLATINGQFHDGIDSVPSTGTYLLEKGERVVDARLNRDLTDALASSNGGSGETVLNFNIQGVEDPEVINKVIQANRGKFESMIREIHADHALSAPF